MGLVVELNGARHVLWQCKTCGVWGTCPEVVYDRHQESGGYHFCPNGHQWGWSKESSEEAKTRRERDRLKQETARLEDVVRAERARADKAEASTKRLKKRASAGTCPCCQRTFSNMSEHMKHRHPQFVTEGGAKVVQIKRAKA